MVGMLQVITYMLGFLVVLKGIELFQMGLTAPKHGGLACLIGFLMVPTCIVLAIYFCSAQDRQALSVSRQAQVEQMLQFPGR